MGLGRKGALKQALRRRGSLTVWFTDEAIAAWRAEPRATPGGQPHYSTLAITTALTMRAVFRLALRQTEGLVGSIIALLGLDLTEPHRVSRRPFCLRPTRQYRSAQAGHNRRPRPRQEGGFRSV